MAKLSEISPPRLIAVSFLTVIIIGAFLLKLPVATINGNGLATVDAIFMATSATCVTGLSVITVANDLSLFGQLVLLGLIQIGGLGIMTIATMVALSFGRKISFRQRIAMREALNHNSLTGVVGLTQLIIGFTLFFEGIGMVLLSIEFIPTYGLGRGLYYSLFHSVSAFNNAGFDLFGNSLEGFVGDWYVNGVIMALIILGGLGFAVIAELADGNRFMFRRYSIHTKMVILLTAALIVCGFLVIFIGEYNNPDTLGPLPLGDKVIASLFQSVSPRTAGFNSIPMGAMQVPSIMCVIFLMFIGASPGSTGGGIKTTTFGIILLAVLSACRGKTKVTCFKRNIPIDHVFKALAVVTIAIVAMTIFLTALSVTEEVEFLPLLFEVVSAFSTSGLSMGITSSLTEVGRILLVLLMYMGRIGPLTLAIALTSRRKESNIEYPDGYILVG